MTGTGPLEMKLRTLAAVVVIAHALVHPALHALTLLPSGPVGQPRIELPASPASSSLGTRNACPACLEQRGFAATLVLLPEAPLEWQQILSPPLTAVSYLSIRPLPARAPPASSGVEGSLA